MKKFSYETRCFGSTMKPEIERMTNEYVSELGPNDVVVSTNLSVIALTETKLNYTSMVTVGRAIED